MISEFVPKLEGFLRSVWHLFGEKRTESKPGSIETHCDALQRRELQLDAQNIGELRRHADVLPLAGFSVHEVVHVRAVLG